MASFFRGGIKIFRKWNDRLRAEFGSRDKDVLNATVTEEQNMSYIYGDYMNGFIHSKVKNLVDVLKASQDKYFSAGARQQLIDNFEKISKDAEVSRESRPENEADI